MAVLLAFLFSNAMVNGRAMKRRIIHRDIHVLFTLWGGKDMEFFMNFWLDRLGSSSRKNLKVSKIINMTLINIFFPSKKN